MDRKTLIGAVLMLIGIVMFVPAIQPTSSGFSSIALVVAVLLLTVGTYIIGTNTEGRPV